MVRDEPAGERLVPGFERLGWKVHRGLVMAHRRQPERTATTGVVREVDEATLRPARRTQLAGEPWATPDLVEQLLAAKLTIARAVTARFFAVFRRWSGGQLYGPVPRRAHGADRGRRDAPETSRRGYASALVVRSLQEARRAGFAEPVNLGETHQPGKC
jgi:hypothetical protein